MPATLVGLVAVLLWGAAIPLHRVFFDQLGAAPATAGVFGVAGLCGLVFAVCHGQSPLRRENLRNVPLLLRWVTFVLHEGLVLLALSLVARDQVPVVILLNYLWPTATLLCCVAFAGLRVTKPVVFGLGCVLVCLSLVIEFGYGEARPTRGGAASYDALAYLLAVGGALCWGLYSAVSRRFAASAGGPHVICLFQLTLVAVLPLWIAAGGSWDAASWLRGLPALMAFGAALFVSYLVWDLGLRRGNVVVLSLGADFIPWISLAVAALLLGAPLTTRTGLSVAVLVGGAMVTRYGTRSVVVPPAVAASGTPMVERAEPEKGRS